LFNVIASSLPTGSPSADKYAFPIVTMPLLSWMLITHLHSAALTTVCGGSSGEQSMPQDWSYYTSRKFATWSGWLNDGCRDKL